MDTVSLTFILQVILGGFEVGLEIFYCENYSDSPCTDVSIEAQFELSKRGFFPKGSGGCFNWVSEVVFAKSNNEIIGVLIYKKDKYQNKNYLELAYVVPKRRGEGVFKAMLNELIKRSSDAGVSKIQWGTHYQNHEMLSASIAVNAIQTFITHDLKVEKLGEGKNK